MWTKLNEYAPIVWHWISTSRYTRYLETDNNRLRAENDALLRALYPALRSVKTEAVVRSEAPKAMKPFRY